MRLRKTKKYRSTSLPARYMPKHLHQDSTIIFLYTNNI